MRRLENGLLLFLRVDDFAMALARARALVGRFEDEPNVNPGTGNVPVLSARSGRLLRHDQCPFASLTQIVDPPFESLYRSFLVPLVTIRRIRRPHSSCAKLQ